jgi:hypothetical protein
MTERLADDAAYIAQRMKELELEKSIPAATVEVPDSPAPAVKPSPSATDWDYGCG